MADRNREAAFIYADYIARDGELQVLAGAKASRHSVDFVLVTNTQSQFAPAS